MAAMIPPGAMVLGIAIRGIGTGHYGMLTVWEHAKANPSEAMLVVFLFSLQPVMGISLALWAARRRGLDRWQTRPWIAWAFFFGPYGSLAILATYPRIARQPCGACQQPTRVDLGNCEHCHQSLDTPSRTGIEIFDHEPTALAGTTEPATV